MRWSDPATAFLDLLKGSPVNCLLLEKGGVSADVVRRAAGAGLQTMVVIEPGASSQDVEKASALKASGVVFEGNFKNDSLAILRTTAKRLNLAIVELPPRVGMNFDEQHLVAGTYQGVWPGIQVEEGGSAKAAPSGAPWINTNSGFLRFMRAATGAPVWIGVRPPAKTVITAERYLQAISDAAITGAQWIIALDEEFRRKLLDGDETARKNWQRMMDLARFYASHPEWRDMKPAGQLAILQDASSGALLSGGVLDMIAVKHTPVRPIPTRKLDPGSMEGTRMAVNVDPSALTEEQKKALRAWTRAGGTLLSGPVAWKFPPPREEQITLSEEDVTTLDEIWKEMNSMTGRKNLGARLFNVSSMLSNFIRSSTQSVLHLVNYSGFPVENVTVHLLGKFKSASLLAPGAEPKKLEVYEVDEGTGIDIDTVGVAATLVLE